MINCLLPGMVKHGDAVGNRKGLVLIVTQNGPILASATTSLLSDRACLGGPGAAQILKKKQAHSSYVSYYSIPKGSDVSACE